jgi:hypothetical protein
MKGLTQDTRLSTSLLAGTAFVVLVITTPIAFAASPHFIGTPTIRKNSNFSLTANFKAAGLANVVTRASLSSGNGTANLQCVNPGGNNPPPKQVSFGPLQGQVVTVQPRNGQITGTVSIGPPPLPSASQICPNPNWSVKVGPIRMLYYTYSRME